VTTTHVQHGLRGPSLVGQLARQTAGELRRNARRRNEHEQRLAVMGLLHDDPVLLVEAVLRLARSAPDYTAAEAMQLLEEDEEARPT
jgi:hypothetical protein